MQQQWSRYTGAGRQAERGYVLVIVMGLLGILGVLSLSLRAATQTSLEQTRHFQDGIAAEFLSRAGIDWVIHHMNTLEKQGTMWQALWLNQPAAFQEHKLGPGTFDVSYRDTAGLLHYGIQDEEARLHINTAPSAALAALPGLSPDIANAIVSQRQQEPWSFPEELVQRGLITPQVWYGSTEQTGLNAYLTTWGSGKINVNTAPPVLLAALPGSSSALVEAIMHYRHGEDTQAGTADDRRFRTLQEIASLPGMDRDALERLSPLLTVTSSAFRFVATGRVTHRMGQAQAHQRFAVIERTANTTSLRYWRKVE